MMFLKHRSSSFPEVLRLRGSARNLCPWVCPALSAPVLVSHTAVASGKPVAGLKNHSPECTHNIVGTPGFDGADSSRGPLTCQAA